LGRTPKRGTSPLAGMSEPRYCELSRFRVLHLLSREQIASAAIPRLDLSAAQGCYSEKRARSCPFPEMLAGAAMARLTEAAAWNLKS